MHAARIIQPYIQSKMFNSGNQNQDSIMPGSEPGLALSDLEFCKDNGNNETCNSANPIALSRSIVASKL
jgi:hypothetical protein